MHDDSFVIHYFTAELFDQLLPGCRTMETGSDEDGDVGLRISGPDAFQEYGHGDT